MIKQLFSKIINLTPGVTVASLHRGGTGGAPPKPNPNWEGDRPPLSFLPPSSSFPLLLLIGKRGVLLPVGVGLPPWARHPPWLAPSSTPLYTGAGGTPQTQQLIIDLLAVCGAPLHHNPR